VLVSTRTGLFSLTSINLVGIIVLELCKHARCIEVHELNHVSTNFQQASDKGWGATSRIEVLDLWFLNPS